MVRPIALYGRKAAEGVERYKKVTMLAPVLFEHPNMVAQAAKDARPTQRGDTVARSRSGRRWGNKAYSHGERAHVRKPANTSRRSGR